MLTAVRLLARLTPLFLCTAGALMAEPIGWMERYALADDRQATLSELIPGSEDYYFYHCLHYQTTGQLDQSEAMLNAWLAENDGRETPVIRGMLDRQRLLTYRQSPQRTIDYLISRLGVQLNHAPPATKGERRYPSELAARAIQMDRLVIDALNRNDRLKPDGMRYLAEKFLRDDLAGLPINLHQFLKRIDDATLTRLDELVIKELKSRPAKEVRFGDLAAHQFLTLQELARVARQVPAVADDNAFVDARLVRLRPGADSDPSQQIDVRLEYLRRVESYVRTLPPSYNSLKASATYRLLQANLAVAEFDRELFMRFLQLPRSSPIVHPQWIRRMPHHARLADDFMKKALLPPVGDEQPLVRTYLEHFLRDADDPEAFAQYLKPEYLRRVFAETKLLSGLGDPDRWYRMLTGPERQAIRDSVQLRLADENPARFDDGPTELSVDIKNIRDLVVRVYEINTDSYYRTHEKAIDTDIDLDGLVATHEKSFRYQHPAEVRHRETIRLDEITGRGVWIVDLVGEGLRARAMIRRGALHHVDGRSADGMVFTIINEDRRPVAGATMLVGSQEFVADEGGRIVLPPVADKVNRKAIISDGKISTPIRFSHLREDYSLSAGMHLDRTQVQSSAGCRILIRPQLRMSGQVIDPATLTDVNVQIHATDLEGIATTKTLDDLTLDQNKELVVPIRVPSRLSNLKVTLSGKLAGLADRRQRTLSTSHGWDIAGVRRTHHTYDAFLTKDDDEFVIEVRGRTGELIAGATVNVVLTTNARQATVDQTLQSDDQGRVRLSPLDGVTAIRFGVAGGVQHERDLRLDRVIWPSVVHTTSDAEVRLPVDASDRGPQDRFRFVELRAGSVHADRSESVKIDNGMLVLEELPAGDYQLINRSTGRVTQMVSVDGPNMDSIAVGRVRHRELAPAMPIAIRAVDRGEEGLQIKLSGDTRSARVHLYASRYLDSDRPADALHVPLPGLAGRGVSLPRCGYVSDLRLGDEYQYVLRRRFAEKYPGVMLPSPGVILNPWETEETTNQTQAAVAGEAAPPSAAQPKSSNSLSREADYRESQQAVGSDYDFLADSGVLIANLAADEDGIVHVSDEAITGLPLIQVVVSNATTTIQRTVTAPLHETETVDLRLAESLSPDRALSFQRAVSIVSKDKPLDLASLGTAQLQVYGDVASLMKLYRTLIDDPRLDEFEVLSHWDRLDRDAKLEAYSRLASHELHLFLWSHDREFFDETISPYLANKKEKQFVDHWLLQDDLSGYADLWQYNQLNAAERALLAMRRPESAESIRRELREVVAQTNADNEHVRRQIESALKLRKLGESLAVEEAADFEEAGAPQYDMLFADGSSDSNADAFAFEGVAGTKIRKRGQAMLGQSVAGGIAMGRAFRGRSSGAMGGGGFGFYRDLDTTKQWAESHWDRVRVVGGPSPAGLIVADAFWADLASCDVDDIRGSSNVLLPTRTRHSAIAALAFCGLPLKAGQIGLPEKRETPYAPEHPVVVVSKRLQTLQPADDDASILIGQRFMALNADNDERDEEPTEFLTGEAYRGQTVVSNPTAKRRTVDVFWQLPAGSMPLGGSQTTDSQSITLQPFAVQAIQYQFYFPKAGEFNHYPATVADNGKLIAQANEKRFLVRETPTEDDSITWETLVRNGTPSQLADFLKDANLRKINWSLVAHRMQDQQIYQTIIKTLGEANLPVAELWAYSLKHRDESAMSRYLAMRDDLADRVGPVLRSPLLDIDPIKRRKHELLEYAPLVRARIHRLGDEHEILNPTFLNQYREFIRVLSHRADFADDEELVLAYYLLIQNRIREAIDSFNRVDAEAVTAKLQYEYMNAYLAMHRGDFAEAERVASTHAGHPIARWRQRFGELKVQLEQRKDLMDREQLVSVKQPSGEPQGISEGSADLAVLDRERYQRSAAAMQPEVAVRVEGNTLRIDHRRAKNVTMNLYGVDLELLFSKAPFVREDLQRMAMVRPMQSDSITFDNETGVGHYDLKREFAATNVACGSGRRCVTIDGPLLRRTDHDVRLGKFRSTANRRFQDRPTDQHGVRQSLCQVPGR